MRIMNHDNVLGFLDAENSGNKPNFHNMQMQIHIDFMCGCKITQDKKADSLFPCSKHKDWANKNADNKTLHKCLH